MLLSGIFCGGCHPLALRALRNGTGGAFHLPLFSGLCNGCDNEVSKSLGRCKEMHASKDVAEMHEEGFGSTVKMSCSHLLDVCVGTCVSHCTCLYIGERFVLFQYWRAEVCAQGALVPYSTWMQRRSCASAQGGLLVFLTVLDLWPLLSHFHLRSYITLSSSPVSKSFL